MGGGPGATDAAGGKRRVGSRVYRVDIEKGRRAEKVGDIAGGARRREGAAAGVKQDK